MAPGARVMGGWPGPDTTVIGGRGGVGWLGDGTTGARLLLTERAILAPGAVGPVML